MTKARDVMTRAVVTCSQDTSVAEAARLMRNHNIGDVLVLEDNKLRGIITDRDIAIRGVADGENLQQTPVKNYMSTDLITGRPDWDLKRVAETMGKHQIRRLPILENGSLAGIVSMGDVALEQPSESTVAESLKEVSESPGVHQAKKELDDSGKRRVLLGMLISAALALLFAPKPGRELRKQVKSMTQRRSSSFL